MDFCQGADWKPRSTVEEPGTCGACGKPLKGRNHWFCRSPNSDDDNCRLRYMRNHDWGYARRAALRRAGSRCSVLECGATSPLEVNHIEPRRGLGYDVGCHNHQDGLEVLCRPHHQDVTNRQRVEAKVPNEQIPMEMT